MEWDTAAGQAICTAVGLTVIDRQTGKPMKYNRENLLNNYFLVSALAKSYKRHIAKSITWRIIGTMDTILLSWLISGNPLTV